MHILIVEDDHMIAGELRNQLTELGYHHLTTRHNANDVLQNYYPDAADFVIMDIGLSGSHMDGISLAHKLLQIKKVPLIFLSAFSDEHTLSRAKEVTHMAYLVKPCSTRQLFVSIENALNSFYTYKPTNHSIQEPSCPLFSGQNHFYAKKNSHYERVNIDDILWIESTRGGIYIHSIFGKYMITTTLASFERQVQHRNLIRIHKSHIINKNRVTAINDKEVIIEHKDIPAALPCGGSYINEFKDHFLKLKSD
ncbi:MAG: response regulator transcription factor [Saprospiraceae bacterium]